MTLASWLPNGNGAFPARDTAAGFKFKDNLFISNGYINADLPPMRDLWRSVDGRTWVQVLSATPYDPYSAMGVIGEYVYAVNKTVWRSSDTINWVKISDTSPLGYPALPKMVSMGGRLWLATMSGFYSSKDGIVWRTEHFPMGMPAGSFGLAEMDGAIYRIGGYFEQAANPPEVGYPSRTASNMVWRFANGVWTMMTAAAPWEPRMWPGVCSANGRLYLLGGYSNRLNANLGDSWESPDGANWTTIGNGGISPRHEPTMLAVTQIVCIAGNAWPVQKDLWSLTVTS